MSSHHFGAALARCLWSLSCWKIHLLWSSSSFSDGNKLSSRISQYFCCIHLTLCLHKPSSAWCQDASPQHDTATTMFHSMDVVTKHNILPDVNKKTFSFLSHHHNRLNYIFSDVLVAFCLVAVMVARDICDLLDTNILMLQSSQTHSLHTVDLFSTHWDCKHQLAGSLCTCLFFYA